MSELVPGGFIRVPARISGQHVQQPGLAYAVHSVDLPSGGRAEGMDRETALSMARALGTRAYRAVAVLVTSGPQEGLIIVSPIQELRP